MKRIFTVIAVLAAMVSASSCDYCDCKPLDPSSYATQWQIFEYTPGNNWDLVRLGETEFYRAKLNCPQLTRDIFKSGLVTVSIYTDDSKSTVAPLPYIYYNKGQYDDGTPALWQEKIDFEYQPGTVWIYHTVSDFQYPDGCPSGLTFRVTLTY